MFDKNVYECFQELKQITFEGHLINVKVTAAKYNYLRLSARAKLH